MAQDKAETRQLPPYVPWRTFRNFIDGLRSNMPMRIDKGLMGSMSGATQGQLISALRFMGLITDNGTPTQRLRDFVKADGEARTELMSDLFFAAYRPIIDAAKGETEEANFLDNGTYRQLSEAFAATSASGDTLRKCVAFFLLMAKDAGITLSPHFHVRGARAASAPRRRRAGGRSAETIEDEEEDDDEGGAAPTVDALRTRYIEMLMEKAKEHTEDGALLDRIEKLLGYDEQP